MLSHMDMNSRQKAYHYLHKAFATDDVPEGLMTEYKEVMSLKATRGATSGKLGRLRSLCNLFLEAKTEGKATGKAWWQAGVFERSDYAREEWRRRRQCTTQLSSTIGTVVAATDYAAAASLQEEMEALIKDEEAAAASLQEALIKGGICSSPLAAGHGRVAGAKADVRRGRAGVHRKGFKVSAERQWGDQLNKCICRDDGSRRMECTGRTAVEDVSHVAAIMPVFS